MAAEVTFIYRCRKCGKEYSDAATGEPLGLYVLIATVHGRKMPEHVIGLQPEMLGIHTCDNDNMGVSDLIGTHTERSEEGGDT